MLKRLNGCIEHGINPFVLLLTKTMDLKEAAVRLSRRGWNNVIVFGVLTLFVLFYIVPHLLKGSQQQVQLILPHQQYLEYRFPKAKLSNVAGQWQWQPATTLSVDGVMQAWQGLQLAAAVAEPEITASVCQVELVVTGLESNLQLELRTGASADYLHYNNQWHPLVAGQINQLCPVSLR